MGVSLQKAARQLLKWNLVGLAMGGMPRRGIYLAASRNPDKCFACKIGLVMLGRYGRKRAMDEDDYPPIIMLSVADYDLRMAVTYYGPKTYCPVDVCKDNAFLDEYGEQHIGGMTEHLFEVHKWSVMRIDKWLAEYGDTTVEEAQAAIAA